MDRNFTGGYAGGRNAFADGKKSVVRECRLRDIKYLFARGAVSDDVISELEWFLEPEADNCDVPHLCLNCHNGYTVNRSYGKYDCQAHYGHLDYTNPKAYGCWSCCQRHERSEGCTRCEHVDAAGNGYGASSRLPCFEMPLGFLVVFCNALEIEEETGDIVVRRRIEKTRIQFLDRYFQSKAPISPDDVRVNVVYLQRGHFERLERSRTLARKYAKVPFDDTGEIAMIDLVASVVRFPLIRPNDGFGYDHPKH